IWYKYLAPPSDLFSSTSSMLVKATTISRYGVVLQWYGKEFLRFGGWWVIPLTVGLLALFIVVGHHAPSEPSAAKCASIWTLGLTLAGYFAIYVMTPNELHWHLRFSLNRLFLAIWPSVLFLFFSSVSFRTALKVPK